MTDAFVFDAVGTDIPDNEKIIIEEVADEYGLQGSQRLLLHAIRKIEGGRPGLEFGIKHKEAINTTFKNQAQWAAGSIKKRFTGDIVAFRDRFAPIGADNDPSGLNKNWLKNASFYLKKWGTKLQQGEVTS